MSTTLLAPPHETASKVALWYTRCPVPTSFGLALQLGFLNEEFADDSTTDFRALQQSTDLKVHQSHFTHTQKNSFRHGGNYPAIYAQSTGANTRVIGLSWVHGPQTILALPGSGIKTAADLKGKRLLVHRRPKEDIDFSYATEIRTYEAGLASVGLSLKDVHLVEHVIDRTYVGDRRGILQPGGPLIPLGAGRARIDELVYPLIRGEVDAIAGGSIGVASERLHDLFGFDVVFDAFNLPDQFERYNNSTPLTFAVNAELIDEHPELVARVYARVLEAELWAQENRDDTVRFVAREQSAAERLVESAYGENLVPGLKTDLDPIKIKGLTASKNFLLKHGLIKNDFDVEKWVDPRPLAAAKHLLAKRHASGELAAPQSGTSRKPSGVAASSGCSIRQ